MSVFYIRRIRTTVWDSDIPANDDPMLLGTNGVTNCCKTDKNQLSVWIVNNNDPDSYETKLVLSTIAGGSEKPSSISYVYIEDSELAAIGVTLKQTPGNTAISSKKNLHWDIEDLNMEKISKIGLLIQKKVYDNNQIHKKGAGKIKEYVRAVFPDGTPEAEDIKSVAGWCNIYNTK